MKDKNTFLKEHGMELKFKELEKSEKNLWNELCKIEKHYINQKSFHKDTMRSFIASIEDTDTSPETEEYIKHIHSIRYRLKDVESLIVKIIEKKYENKGDNSKYTNINRDNYYKIITDLIGVRIIFRNRNEWQPIHKLIWDKFYNEEREYIKDYEKDYFGGKDIFIAEKPIVYYRDNNKKKDYEIFGKNIFDIQRSDIGYSSIHYVINVNGTYIELQVRTIYDEAWSECDHDFVYKLNASPKKLILKRCSKMLSDVTGIADTMSTFIEDYSNDKIEDENIKKSLGTEIISESKSDKFDIDWEQYSSTNRTKLNIEKVSDVFKKYQF